MGVEGERARAVEAGLAAAGVDDAGGAGGAGEHLVGGGGDGPHADDVFGGVAEEHESRGVFDGGAHDPALAGSLRVRSDAAPGSHISWPRRSWSIVGDGFATPACADAQGRGGGALAEEGQDLAGELEFLGRGALADRRELAQGEVDVAGGEDDAGVVADLEGVEGVGVDGERQLVERRRCRRSGGRRRSSRGRR
jgi:hypothetical protein